MHYLDQISPRFYCFARSASLILGLWAIGALSSQAATRIQVSPVLFFTLDELEHFADTGEFPVRFVVAPQSDKDLYLESRPNLVRLLEDEIDVDLENIDSLTLDDLDERHQEKLFDIIPTINDEQYREAARGLDVVGDGQRTIDFLRAFPEDVLRPKDFLNTLISYVPIDPPTAPDPDPQASPTPDPDPQTSPTPDPDPQTSPTPDPEPQPLTPEVTEPLNVLWYGYGDNTNYNNQITGLAAAAPGYDPWGDGSLDWDLTFWNPADATPDFGDFDVFVIGSAFQIPHKQILFDANRLFSHKSEIELARGNRTFLSGQDADVHFLITHGFQPDGPFGFLVNAVNWAGSGHGLGIVSLTDGLTGGLSVAGGSASRWWLHDNSFLKDELDGYVSYFNTNSVLIPDETADFAVNEGLTSPGLSDPGTNVHYASHAAFQTDIPGYKSINYTDRFPNQAVTIVTADQASGATNNPAPVPEPLSVLGVLSFGGLGLALFKRQ